MTADRGLRPDRYAQETAELALSLARTALAAGGSEPAAPAPVDTIDLVDVASGDPLAYTLTPEDSGRVFALYDEAGVELTIPDTLPDGFHCGVLGFSTEGLSLLYSAWDPPPGFPADEVHYAFVPLALTIAVTAGGLLIVGGSARPDTVTVVYASGWPTARPYADHVIAVGHTSEPAWLTSADVWLEAV